MELSEDQKKALRTILDWEDSVSKRSQYITLGGYAGTGKTTLIAKLRQELKAKKNKQRVAFASYTGKAARVLKNKLTEVGVMEKDDSVGTIHSLIYSPIVNDKKEIAGWKRKDEIEADLIVIDEASMVDGDIWRDLAGYGKPIVAVGDHGQLPPIRGSFNLMEKPMLRLEEIHRQAKGNPIIEISMMARMEGRIEPKNYGVGVVKMDKREPEAQERVEEILRAYDRETLILCGYNNTRIRLNGFIREARGFETPEPGVADRVICLRNNHQVGIYNGMLGTITQIYKKNEEWYEAGIELDGEKDEYEGLILAKQFNAVSGLNFGDQRKVTLKGDLFDFGYALTVHKAQGSQAKRVVLFEERFGKMSEDEWRRWLYTGVTRAGEELLIVG